jgi:Holliday junction resolvasome RuvABC endonuclease subunit
MRIIACDLGKNMAFAWRQSGRIMTLHHSLTGGIRAHRLSSLMAFLPDMFSPDFEPFGAVVYETPFARGRDATRVLWGIAGIIEACATKAGLPVVDVAVPTIKKFATGSGKGSKEEMLAAARKFGYRGANEHEADAVCLLCYAEANIERVVKS